MGNMSWGEAAEIIGVVAAFWHLAMYVGIILSRMRTLEIRVDQHEKRLDGHDEFIRG